MKFLEALIETVDRLEECHRIGNVNRHRQPQGAARLPHRVEPPVVHLDQFASAVPQIQSQRLEHLQTARTVPFGLFHQVHLQLRISGLIGAAPPWFRKRDEAARIRTVEFVHGLPKTPSTTAGEIHQRANVAAVHHVQ